jgi:Fe-S cluster biogenesis protein NfuA
MTTELTTEVQKALEEIRPLLNSDGGDISLVSIEEGKHKVRLEGACTSCSVNQMTLRAGVETTKKVCSTNRDCCEYPINSLDGPTLKAGLCFLF